MGEILPAAGETPRRRLLILPVGKKMCQKPRQIFPVGKETLLLGLALPDCRAHAPDENFPVENFEAGIRLNKALLEELARG